MANPVRIDLRGVPPWDDWKARQEIRKALALGTRYAALDHIERIVADSLFDGDRPYALTFDPQAEGFRCTVLLNCRRKEYFGRWPRVGALARMLWLLQAYFSTVLAREQYEAGHAASMTFGGVSPETTLDAILAATRSSYVTDKRVDRVLRENLQSENGETLSLMALYDEDGGWPVFQIARDELDALPGAFTAHLELLKRGATDEMSAWGKCAGLVSSLLMSLASIAAAFDDTGDWTWRQARLYDHPAFKRFFEEEWPVLHGDWRATLLRDYHGSRQAAGPTKVALKAIFGRLGIVIRDRPVGVSVLDFASPDNTES